MPFLEAVRLALQQIRVQKLKSFFTLLGVMIGVTFLIAVVSIVGGMSRYMKDEVVGKIMAVNSFELRHRPNINIGEMSRGAVARAASPPAHQGDRRRARDDALPHDVKWAVVGQRQAVRAVALRRQAPAGAHVHGDARTTSTSRRWRR